MFAVSFSKNFKTRLALAFILSFAGSILFYALCDPAQLKLFKEGDFSDYYAVAHIIKEKTPHRLYDFELQKEIQARYWPDMTERALYFRYPPFDALLLYPLSYVDPIPARILYSLFMIICLGAACILAARFAPVLKDNKIVTAALLLACIPIPISIICGQNSALTMLFYAGIIAGVNQGSKQALYLSGLCIGLMLYKPQFGGLWLLWAFAMRKKELIIPAILMGCVWYLMGTWVYGWLWPYTWLQNTAWAVSTVLSVDQHLMISGIGMFQSLASYLKEFPLAAKMVQSFGSLSSLGIFLWMAWCFLLNSKVQNPKLAQNQLHYLLILGGPVTLLVSPHTMFYDFGICFISYAAAFNGKNPSHQKLLWLSLLLINVSMIYRDALAVQPLFFLTIFCAIFIIFEKSRISYHE